MNHILLRLQEKIYDKEGDLKESLAGFALVLVFSLFIVLHVLIA